MPEAPMIPPTSDADRLADAVQKADHAMLGRAAERVGGDENLNAALDFAQTLPPHEKALYQKRLNDPSLADAAVAELTGRYAQSGSAKPYASLEEFMAGAKAAARDNAAGAVHAARTRLTPDTTLQIGN